MKPSPHKNQDDYFDYLAEMGSASINADDMKDLTERIDKKVNSGSVKAKTNGFTTVILVVFTSVLLFVLFNKASVLQIGPGHDVKEESNNDILAQAIMNDSVIKPNAVVPIPAPEKKEENNEHFVIESRDNHFAEDLSVDILPSRNIALLDTSAKAHMTEELVELIPNSPVLYIYDLKVTDFQKLYFKKMKPYTIVENGLSAAFENTEAYKAYKSENKLLNPYTLDMLLKDALFAFSKGKYKQSLVLFDELLNYNKNDVNALFYSGMCQYYKGEYADADYRFNRVFQGENNVFNQEAEWYKALSLQKSGDTKEAIELLLKINKKKGFYADKAGLKLEEIKKK
ncbi:MAG TPA: hypothetical protein VGF30_08180 [Bacteroidia bacterium]